MAPISAADAASPLDLPKDHRPPSTKFTPTMWADTFTSFSLDTQVQETYAKEIEALKHEVRKILIAEENHFKEKLILVDTLERLGVAYHFEQEVEELLHHIVNNSHLENLDLLTTALWFRLLRQHHHNVSSSVFNKFKGTDGKLDKKLSEDAEGLLSLYEASHVRTHGEDILEESVGFTTHYLNLMAPTLKPPLVNRVKRALEQPLHMGVPRIESRYYIPIYECDDSHNELLLNLAKLDFNYLQNLHRKEICDLSRWWRNLDIKSKLTHVRDRVVEAYFLAAAFRFEPQYSFLRSTLAKSVLLVGIMDDTYDNYATVEEGDILTNIIQRWDTSEIYQLSDYMKVVYHSILNIYEDFEREALQQKIPFPTQYVKNSIIELSKAYNQELKWFMGKQTPTFEDYSSNIVVTSTIYPHTMLALLAMQYESTQIFEWVLNEPKIMVAAAKIGRYKNDIGSHEREAREGGMLTAITSYMKQYGVSKQVALNVSVERVWSAWKDINMEWCSITSTIPHDVAVLFLNFARVNEVTYKNAGDGFTYPEKILAPLITDLYVDAIVT